MEYERCRALVASRSFAVVRRPSERSLGSIHSPEFHCNQQQYRVRQCRTAHSSNFPIFCIILLASQSPASRQCVGVLVTTNAVKKIYMHIFKSDNKFSVDFNLYKITPANSTRSSFILRCSQSETWLDGVGADAWICNRLHNFKRIRKFEVIFLLHAQAPAPIQATSTFIMYALNCEYCDVILKLTMRKINLMRFFR